MTIEKRKPKKEKDNMIGKLQPLADRVVVKPVAGQEKTKSGIYIPDTAKERPQEGEIIAAGKGKVNEEGKLRPLDVKEGDRVLFGKYSGTEITIDGEELIIMREEEVLGILVGSKKEKEEKAGSRR